MSKEQLYVVDESGKAVDTIEAEDKYVKLSEGDKVLKRGVVQYLNDTIDLKYRFIKINPHAYCDIVPNYSIFPILTKYIGFMDNILEYANGKNIRRKDIAKICNVSESTVKKTVKRIN